MRWRDSWRNLRSFGARLRRARGGAAAAEFAVIVPAVLVLLTGAINLGTMATYGLALDSAVREAANFAMTCSYDDSSVGVNCTGLSGNPSHATMCSIITGQPTNPCISATVTVTFPNKGASPNAKRRNTAPGTTTRIRRSIAARPARPRASARCIPTSRSRRSKR